MTDLIDSEVFRGNLVGRIYEEPRSEQDRTMMQEFALDKSEMPLFDFRNSKSKTNLFYVDVEGEVIPNDSGEYEFGVTVNGTAKLYINGELVVDNSTDQTQGDSFFGSGTIEELGRMQMEAGRSYSILVEFGSAATSPMLAPGATPVGGGAVRLGAVRRTDLEEEIKKAVALAKEVDQVVICTGLNVSRPQQSR